MSTTAQLPSALAAGLPASHGAEEGATASDSVSAPRSSHFKRVILEIVNFFLNYDWIFRLVGRLNRHYKFIESVFLVYPADDSYTYEYVYEHRRKKVLWAPWLAGILFQNGKITVMFCISANNRYFVSDAEKPNLQRVHDRMEELRTLFKANQKTFAGILPGALVAKRIMRKAPEGEVTARAVTQAVESVMTKVHADWETPVIVLGSNGFIGRKVTALLREKYTTVIPVDVGGTWPSHLKGERVMVINITRRNVIDDYLKIFWSGTIVINEVYPPPSATALAEMQRRGISCYHIVGVKALAIPAFPHEYAGAAPCCAAWPADKMTTVTSELTGD